MIVGFDPEGANTRIFAPLRPLSECTLPGIFSRLSVLWTGQSFLISPTFLFPVNDRPGNPVTFPPKESLLSPPGQFSPAHLPLHRRDNLPPPFTRIGSGLNPVLAEVLLSPSDRLSPFFLLNGHPFVFLFFVMRDPSGVSLPPGRPSSLGVTWTCPVF